MKNNSTKDIIITYSAISQSKNNIMGVGKCLLMYVGIFPFIPLLLSLFSCYVKIIPNNVYKALIFLAGILGMIIMFTYIAKWIKNLMTVFMIDEEFNLYRLKISVFWYKIKDKMYLLNPDGMTGGQLMRIFYMINNIKLVLESVTEDITYEEFINMGKMEKISEIKNVEIKKKRITFNSNIISQKGHNEKKIRLARVFEKDEKFCEYLISYEKGGKEAASKVNFDNNSKSNSEELINNKKNKSPLRKLANFAAVWTCIMAWVAAFTLSSDMGRLSKINSGQYILVNRQLETGDEEIYVNINDDKDYFKKSDYGNLYKPVFVIYVSPLIVYGIMKGADVVIANVKSK